MDYIKEIEDILEDRNEDIWNKNIFNFYNEKISFLKVFSMKLFEEFEISINEKQIKAIKNQLPIENKYILNKLLLTSETLKKDEEFNIGDALNFITIFIGLIAGVIGAVFKDIIFASYFLFMISLLYISFAGAAAQKNQFKSIVYNKALTSIQIAIKESLNELEESNIYSKTLTSNIFIVKQKYRRFLYDGRKRNL